MQVTFNKTDLENPAVRDTIVRIIGDSKHGGFMRVHGFKPKTGYGEIQNGTFCKGINYPNAIKASKIKLAEIKANEAFEVTLTRGTWQDGNGNESPSGRKNKAHSVHVTVTETYDMDSDEMIEALAKVHKSLENPRPAKEYVELGNGVYVDPETDKLYLRALRRVSKQIVKHGKYPPSAKSAVVALAKEIKDEMPIGYYRQFNLDGDYDKLTFGGIELSPESQEKIEGFSVPSQTVPVEESETAEA